MIAQRNQRDHLLFCFSICRFDCIACDNFFVINNGHFLNWQNVYLVGNQLEFTSLNGTHILPRLCNPKLLFALFSNLKCLSSRQVNKCKRKKNPLNVQNSIYLQLSYKDPSMFYKVGITCSTLRVKHSLSENQKS